EGGVDEHRILVAALVGSEIVPELPDRLDEGERFDVADGPANLADDEIEAVHFGEGEFLDRVGDVRDDLDGGAQIVAAPLAGDDVAVDAARGDVVALARGHSGEALIMAEVQ